MITHAGFWKGRDKQFASELTGEIVGNAKVSMERVNRLLAMFYAANPTVGRRDANSGWRPKAVNTGTKGSSPTSLHMVGKAVDVDDDDEALDNWLKTPQGMQALVMCELWLEHPGYTPRWCHLQTIPPKSGNRVFIPR
jgi:hypothetical protein